KETREPPAARAADVRPPRPAIEWDGGRRLLVPAAAQHRQVDAPEAARAVAVERLEQDPARDPAGDAGLDHLLRPEVANDAPDDPGHPRIGVVHPLAHVRARGGERPLEVAPDGVELLGGRAWKRRAEQLVQAPLGVR